MSVEPGQLRVWKNVITRDKTPFLVLEEVDHEWGTMDWQILWHGQLECWPCGRIECFSDVFNEAG